MSTDPDALRRRVLESTSPAEQTVLTAALAAHDTPLLTDDPADPTRQRVLLTFTAPPGTAGVYAWVNRLTDTGSGGPGQMRRRGDSDLWFTEFTIDRGTVASYRFYPYTADDPALRDGVLRYDRAVAQAAVDDPLFADPGSPFGSVIAGSAAPDLRRWRRPAARPREYAATGALPGGTRWRLTAPTGGDGPARLVVLFDAQTWFDRCDLPAVLATGPGRPTALLGIDAPPRPADRLAQLGADRDFLAAVADQALQARRRLALPGAPIVWAGQSLGGLSALAAAAWFPDRVDDLLVYSPSMWWRPGLTSRPAEPGPGTGWIGELLTAVAPRPLTLAVGENEDLLTRPVAALAQTLTARGWPVVLHRYPGGHDLPWWAHLLATDLRG